MKFGSLHVTTRDGRVVEFPLELPTTVVGRADGSGVLIDDLSISRRHARLIFDSGRLLVEDLGAAGGTFVHGERLTPNAPRLLEDGDSLRFGDMEARFVSPPPEVVEQPAATAAPASTSADYAPASGLRLALASPAMSIEPGRGATATLTIHNRGHVVDQISIAVPDLPADWVRVSEPQMSLLPGGRADVAIVITPPRHAEAIAGHYDFTVTVTSQEHERDELVIGQFTILPFEDTVLGFEPVRGRRDFRVIAENHGNAVRTYTLEGHDDEEAFRYRFEAPAIELQPGQKKQIQLRVARPRVWVGTPSVRPFRVVARHSPPDGGEIEAVAQLAIHPPLQKFRMPVMFVAMMAVVATVAFGVLLIQGRGGAKTASAEDPYAGVHMCDKSDAKASQDQKNQSAAAAPSSSGSAQYPGGAKALIDPSGNGAPFFAQNNALWGKQEYAKAADPEFGPDWCGTTIEQCGCAMTSVTTIMGLFEILTMPDGQALTPKTVNDWFNLEARKTPRGWVSQGYIYGDVIWTAANQLSGEIAKAHPGSRTIRFVRTGSGSDEEIRNELKAGRPIVLEVPGHWIAAVGLDGDKILINDPYYRDRKTLDVYAGKVKSSVLFEPSDDLSAVVFTAPADVRFRITDKQGRVVGTLDTGSAEDAEKAAVNQIPGASYSSREAWRDPSCVESAPPVGAGTNQVILPGKKEDYKIEIIDTEKKKTSVAVHTYDKNGTPSISTIENSGSAVAEVNVDPASGQPQIKVINGAQPTPESQFTPGGAGGGEGSGTQTPPVATIPPGTATPTPLPELRTSMSLAAEPGQTRVEVADNSGFTLGDPIRFAPGLPNQEDNIITGFGSFILATPLKFTHSPGEAILRLARPPGQGPGLPPGITPAPSSGGPLKPPDDVVLTCNTIYEQLAKTATLFCDVTVTGTYTNTRWTVNGVVVTEFTNQPSLLLSYKSDGPANVAVSVCNITICRSTSHSDKIQFSALPTGGGGAGPSGNAVPVATPPAQGVTVDCTVEFVQGRSQQANLDCEALFLGPFTSVSWSAPGANPASGSGNTTKFKTSTNKPQTVKVSATVCNFSKCSTSDPKSVGIGATTTTVFPDATVNLGNQVNIVALVTGNVPPKGGQVTFYAGDNVIGAGVNLFTGGSTGYAQLQFTTGASPLANKAPAPGVSIRAQYTGGTTTFGSLSDPKQLIIEPAIPDSCNSIDDPGSAPGIDDPATPGSPGCDYSSFLTAGGKNLGGGTVLTGLTISGTTLQRFGPNDVVVAPGTPLSISSTANRTDYCPGCVRQVYLGIGGNAANSPPTAPIGPVCVYSGGLPASAPGVTLATWSQDSPKGAVPLFAPTVAGRYYVRASTSLDFFCLPVGVAPPELSVGRIIVQDSPNVNVALAASANPVTLGDNVTFQATVSPKAAAGSLEFFIDFLDDPDGPKSLTPTPLPVNQANCPISPDACTDTRSITLSTGPGGSGTPTIPLPIGNYSITAKFTQPPDPPLGGYTATNPPPYYREKTSPPLSVVVQKAPAAVALAITPSNTQIGNSVNFKATVTGPFNPNGGTVQFYAGANAIGPPVSVAGAGIAQLDFVTGPFPLDTAFTYTDIKAAYNGNSELLPQDSALETLTLARRAPSVTLAFNPVSPIVLGTSVTLTATVTAGAIDPNPNGKVDFTYCSLGPANCGTPDQIATGIQLVAGVATFTTTAGALGSPFFTATTYSSVRASYSGNGNVLTGASPGADFTVNRAATSTNMDSVTPSTAILGDSIALKATVTTTAPYTPGPGDGAPGTVTFYATGGGATGVKVGSAAVGVAGVATLNFTTGQSCVAPCALETKGTYNFSASYDGSGNLDSSDSTNSGITLTLNPRSPTLALSFTPGATFTVGDSSAKVTATLCDVRPGPSCAPSPFRFDDGGASIEFFDGNASLGVVDIANGADSVQLPLNGLNAGSHSISAAYSGNSRFAATTPAAQNVTISPATPTVTLQSITSKAVGQTISITAQVTAPNNVSPSAGGPAVEFFLNGVSLGTDTISGGFATLVYQTGDASLMATAGTYTNITATYAGNTNVASGSTATAQSVVLTAANPTVSITSLPASVPIGSSVNLVGTVTASGITVADCTGCVSFYQGSFAPANLIGTTDLVSQSATFTASTTTGLLASIGAHSIVMRYDDSANSSIQAKTSAAATLTVTKVNPTITFTPPTAVTVGQQVTFNVSVTAAFSPNCTGCVTFKLATGTQIGAAVDVAGGLATLNFTTGAGALPSAGTFTITAFYAGNTSVNGGNASQPLTINQVTSAVAIAAISAVTVGGNITLDATITAAVNPQCNNCVTYHVGSAGGTQLGGAQDVNSSGAVTNLTFSTGGSAIPDPGSYTIYAVYAGNTNVTGGSDNTTVTVNAIVSTVSLVVTPGTAGTTTDSYTLTATIGPGGLGTQTGTVQFQANGVNLGSAVTVSGGQAVLTITLPTGSPTALTAVFTSTNVDYTSGVTSNTVNRTIT
jgi:hypothetical protein